MDIVKTLVRANALLLQGAYQGAETVLDSAVIEARALIAENTRLQSIIDEAKAQPVSLFVKFDTNGEFVTARRNQVGLVLDCDASYLGYYASQIPAQQVPDAIKLLQRVAASTTESIASQWIKVIDEALVMHHVGVVNESDTYDQAKEKLNLLLCAQASPAVAVPEELPVHVLDAVSEALGDCYDCMRTWSAWAHGTMRQGDFVEVRESAERVEEIARAAITAYVDSQQSVVAQQPIELAYREGWETGWADRHTSLNNDSRVTPWLIPVANLNRDREASDAKKHCEPEVAAPVSDPDNVWERAVIEAAEAVVKANQTNTGAEPSCSFLARSMDELLDVLNDNSIGYKPSPSAAVPGTSAEDELKKLREQMPVGHISGVDLFCRPVYPLYHPLLCELYQVLGALDAADTVLDQVSAATHMRALPHKTLLPYLPQQSPRITENDAREIASVLRDIVTNYECGDDVDKKLIGALNKLNANNNIPN